MILPATAGATVSILTHPACSTGESSVDQAAVVGVIADGAGQSGGYCNSGVSMIPTDGPDTSAGTHVFVGAAFTYHNIDSPICAGFNATITTAQAASPGVLTSTSFFTPFEPLKFSVTGGSLPDGLNSSTVYYVCSSGLVRNVSFEISTTLGCITPVNFTTTGTGTIKAQSLKTSDGEGVILGPFGLQKFTHQAAVEQSAAWGNGSSGYQIFPNGGNDQSDNYIFSVSSYGNLQDIYHDANNSSEINFNQVHVSVTAIKLLSNSLVQATSATPGGWPSFACARGNTQGCPVYGNTVAGRPVTAAHAIITENYFKGLANSCAGGGTCDSSFTFIAWDGNNAQSTVTNTIGPPGFASGPPPRRRSQLRRLRERHRLHERRLRRGSGSCAERGRDRQRLPTSGAMQVRSLFSNLVERPYFSSLERFNTYREWWSNYKTLQHVVEPTTYRLNTQITAY